jgi:hypothetical protein
MNESSLSMHSYLGFSINEKENEGWRKKGILQLK